MKTETNKSPKAEKFFFKMDQSLSEKNKLDQEIKTLLWSMDGTLINSRKDLEEFKKMLEAKVKELHTRHPRCKKIHLSTWGITFLQKEDLSVSCGCSTGKIYGVYQNFPK